MKRIIIPTIVVIVLAVTGVVLLNNKKDPKGTVTTNGSESATTETSNADSKKACDILTLEDAKTLIGTNATLLDGGGSQNLATTNDITVDNCSYSADGATLGDMQQLTIQVQSGARANIKQAYENYQKEYPGDPIPEFGATAYFATDTRQVVVLKGNVWFFVGGGSINGGDTANKELAIKSARLALEKLN